MDFDFQMLKEVDAVISAFEKEHVRYALAGGFAVAMYGHVRATKDIDYLCHPDDVSKASDILSDQGYKAYAEPWMFRNSALTLHRFMKPAGGELFHVVDLLVPPSERIYWLENAQRVAWGSSDQISVVSKKHLIEMKKLRDSAIDRVDVSHLERDGQ